MPNRTRLLAQYDEAVDARNRYARLAAEYLLGGNEESALAAAKNYDKLTKKLAEISDKIAAARQEGTF